MMNETVISALRNEVRANATLEVAKTAFKKDAMATRPQFVEGEVYTLTDLTVRTINGTANLPMLVFGCGEHAIRIPAHRVGALPRGIEDSIGRDFRCEKVFYDALGNKAFIIFSPIN